MYRSILHQDLILTQMSLISICEMYILCIGICKRQFYTANIIITLNFYKSPCDEVYQEIKKFIPKMSRYFLQEQKYEMVQLVLNCSNRIKKCFCSIFHEPAVWKNMAPIRNWCIQEQPQRLPSNVSQKFCVTMKELETLMDPTIWKFQVIFQQMWIGIIHIESKLVPLLEVSAICNACLHEMGM